MKKGNKKKFICIILIILVITIIVLLLSSKQDNNKIEPNNKTATIELEEEYSLELGSIPSVDMFTTVDGATIKIYYGDKEVTGPLNDSGEYLVVIKYNDKEYKTKILVEENIPVLTLKELTINENDTYELNNFVVNVSGISEYKLEFTNQDMGKYTKQGVYDISIKLVYDNGKTIVEYTKLTIKELDKSNSNTSNSNQTSNKVSNSNKQTSNKLSNSNKQSNSNSNKNNNSNNTSNNTSNNNSNVTSNSNSNNNTSNNNVSNSNSNTTSNSNSNNELPTVIKQEKKSDVSTNTKYGAKIITTTTYTLVTYSDGATQKKNSSSTSTLDSTGFITSTSSMKSEATSILNSRMSEQNEMLNYVNKYRKEKDSSLNNLVIDRELSLAATIRAMELAYTEYKYKHQRPNGKEFYTVLNDLGIKFKATGENIAYGYGGALITVKQAAEAWKSSPGHYETMTSSKYTKMGVGHVTLLGKEYWVQIFVG